jgi:hypothetical protein
MLKVLTVSNPAVQPVKTITGRYLAHNRLDARGRARLCAELTADPAQIDPTTLTKKQIRMLCRANKLYVNEVRFPDHVKRRQQKRLNEIFNAIGPDARAEACRTIGIERVWSALTAAL